MHLLEVLREECGVTSAKNGCAPEGACGCCMVMIDGRPALSCLRKPEQMDGHDIVTLEGLPEEIRRVIGEAFVLEGGVQCGFCIPGIVVRAAVADRARQDRRSRRDREGARRPPLPLHRLRPHHRCDPDGGRGQEQRRAAADGTAAPPLLRRRLRVEPQSRVRHRQGRLRRRLAAAAGRTRADARREAVRGRHAGAGHAARRDGADRAPARAGPEDSYRGGRRDAGRRAHLHRRRRAWIPGHRHHRSGPAGVRRRGRAHLLRRRFSGDGRGRHAVPRAAGGTASRASTTRCSSRSPIRSRRSSRALRWSIRREHSRPGRRTCCSRSPRSRAATWTPRSRAPRTSSRRRSRRSRSTSRFSSPKRAWRSRRGKASRSTPTARGRSTTSSRSPRC